MSILKSSRVRRHSVIRVGQDGHDRTLDFLEAIERLEKAVVSLSRLLADHAKILASARGYDAWPNVPDEIPSVEEISAVFGLPRAGVARLLHAMVQLNGRVIPDATLCALVGFSEQSLKVYACEARSALHDLGIERGINRERGRGYFMSPAAIVSLIRLCTAARHSLRTSR